MLIPVRYSLGFSPFIEEGRYLLNAYYMQGYGTHNALMVHIHEDERDSLEAGFALAEKFQVPFYVLEHSRASAEVLAENPELCSCMLARDSEAVVSGPYVRNVCFTTTDGMAVSFDPNRIFSRAGVEKTIVMSDGKPPSADVVDVVYAFGEQLGRYVFPSEGDMHWLVALHNNRGGSYSLDTYTDPDNAKLVGKLYKSPSSPSAAYNFVLTNDGGLFDHCKEHDISVVLQTTTDGDGSMSDHAIANGFKYVNVEALRSDSPQVANLELNDNQYGSKVQHCILESVFEYVKSLG